MVIRFANSRGIEILLEIDTPGHTAIIGEAYPDLIACKNKAPWIKYAAEPRMSLLPFSHFLILLSAYL